MEGAEDPLPKDLSGVAVQAEKHAFPCRRQGGDGKDTIAPDDRGGMPFPGKFCLPERVRRVSSGGDVLLRTRAVAAGATPAGPSFGLGGDGRVGQQAGDQNGEGKISVHDVENSPWAERLSDCRQRATTDRAMRARAIRQDPSRGQTMSLRFFSGRIFTTFRAGLALNIASSPVKGLTPLRALVAGFRTTTSFIRPGTV